MQPSHTHGMRAQTHTHTHTHTHAHTHTLAQSSGARLGAAEGLHHNAVRACDCGEAKWTEPTAVPPAEGLHVRSVGDKGGADTST